MCAFPQSPTATDAQELIPWVLLEDSQMDSSRAVQPMRSRTSKRSKPCSLCAMRHIKCNTKLPYSSSLCLECSNAGLQTCLRMSHNDAQAWWVGHKRAKRLEAKRSRRYTASDGNVCFIPRSPSQHDRSDANASGRPSSGDTSFISQPQTDEGRGLSCFKNSSPTPRATVVIPYHLSPPGDVSHVGEPYMGDMDGFFNNRSNTVYTADFPSSEIPRPLNIRPSAFIFDGAGLSDTHSSKSKPRTELGASQYPLSIGFSCSS